jgi:hypothetical protein
MATLAAVPPRRHTARLPHAGALGAHAVMVSVCLGCVGPTRVAMQPPMNGSRPGGEPIQPIEESTAVREIDRDDAIALASEETPPTAQGTLTLASLLQRLFAGSDAPFMFGVFGVFDEDLPHGRLPTVAHREGAQKAAARKNPRCAAFLCGPVTRPR